MRGDLFALLDHLGGGFDDGGAAVHDRFRTAGAAGRQKLVAVALQETNALERDAEPLAQHLRERRRVSLPVIKRTGDDGDGAVGLEAQAAHFLARRRGDLEKVAHAEPAYFSTFAALAFAAREALDIGRFERVLEHTGKVAAVEGDRRAGARLERRDIGHFFRRHEVTAAHICAVEVKLVGDAVEQAFHREGAFRIAGAAHRHGGDLVGLDDTHVELKGRQHVGSGQRRRLPAIVGAPGVSKSLPVNGGAVMRARRDCCDAK